MVNKAKNINNSLVGIRYTTIFPRFSSYFIDQIIIGMVIGLLAAGYGWLSGKDSVFEENLYAYFIISMLYYSLFISSNWQATPGMRFIGLYVTTTKYQKLDIILALIRYILYIVNLLIAAFIALFIGKLIMAIILCDNESAIDLAIFGPNGKMQANLLEMTTQISSQTVTLILGIVLLLKMILIALPMFYTKRKQTLYDYIANIAVIRSEKIKTKKTT